MQAIALEIIRDAHGITGIVAVDIKTIARVLNGTAKEEFVQVVDDNVVAAFAPGDLLIVPVGEAP